MSLSLLHLKAGHPPCLPLQALTGQNCLMPPSASTFSEENHHVKDPCGVTGRNLALLQTPSDLSQAKTGPSEAKSLQLPQAQVPRSGNPTCECSGLRTSLGHPHQAPLTRSSHQTSSSQIYPSHLLCGFLPTPISRMPRMINVKNLRRDFLVVKGLRIHLPVQEMQAGSLAGELRSHMLQSN